MIIYVVSKVSANSFGRSELIGGYKSFIEAQEMAECYESSTSYDPNNDTLYVEELEVV